MLSCSSDRMNVNIIGVHMSRETGESPASQQTNISVNHLYNKPIYTDSQHACIKTCSKMRNSYLKRVFRYPLDGCLTDLRRLKIKLIRQLSTWGAKVFFLQSPSVKISWVSNNCFSGVIKNKNKWLLKLNSLPPQKKIYRWLAFCKIFIVETVMPLNIS
jgi:hypothetical protein